MCDYFTNWSSPITGFGKNSCVRSNRCVGHTLRACVASDIPLLVFVDSRVPNRLLSACKQTISCVFYDFRNACVKHVTQIGF